jgi:hypothetical protein
MEGDAADDERDPAGLDRRRDLGEHGDPNDRRRRR